jgi:hypothetical protein
MKNAFLFDAKIDDEKNLTIVHAQDVNPILEDAYTARKHSRKLRQRNKKGAGEWIGRVPTLVYEDWIGRGLIHPPGCDCGMLPKEHQQLIHAMLELNPQYKTTRKTL